MTKKPRKKAKATPKKQRKKFVRAPECKRFGCQAYPFCYCIDPF